MPFSFAPMTEAFACEIDGWRYDGVYSFYDLAEDPEDREAFLDPESWEDKDYAVLDETRSLVGFFSFTKEGDDVVLGLGMGPDQTGRGLGADFLDAGLAFARQQYKPRAFRLSVATFDQRAIRVYERAGFVRGKLFQQETNGGVYEFLEMSRPA